MEFATCEVDEVWTASEGSLLYIEGIASLLVTGIVLCVMVDALLWIVPVMETLELCDENNDLEDMFKLADDEVFSLFCL